MQDRLEVEIQKLIAECEVKYFGVGGALGFDTMAALTVLKLKKTFPQIRLVLVSPCKKQTKKRSLDKMNIYNQICSQADKMFMFQSITKVASCKSVTDTW